MLIYDSGFSGGEGGLTEEIRTAILVSNIGSYDYLSQVLKCYTAYIYSIFQKCWQQKLIQRFQF